MAKRSRSEELLNVLHHLNLARRAMKRVEGGVPVSIEQQVVDVQEAVRRRYRESEAE